MGNRQVTQSHYGAPDVLEVREVPRPVAKHNEVLIQVKAVSVTLADCAFRQADPFVTRLFNGFLRPRKLVLGSDIGGVVAAVGRDVTRFAVGDAVFGSIGSALGGCADYVCLAEDAAVVRRPEGLDAGDAAGLSYAYLTAMPFLRDAAQLKQGDRVLINGASSSIGVIAVQLAVHFGAEVTAVCSARHAGLIRSLGATHVIDRHAVNFTTAQNAYDVIFDVVGKSSFRRCKAALRQGGIYLTTVPSPATFWHMLSTRKSARRAQVMLTGLRPALDKHKDLLQLVALVQSGAVRPVSDRCYLLAQVAAAHAYVEAGLKSGAVVVEMA
ncbi:NAD(P)-dependent alcohol dehydrogenase [Devosia sp. YR412]|uniref:NAD(P)-dependent alcohol dehydrogenase n=1 Tax=Devosia sp. YR412 TaxID=1881030 RepID=UPI0014801FE0|nr:NAD(P)-dependent alcohol dehydrogenase [Devosia sp. YR412]